MTPDDVRMIAQLVVNRRVHCVGDESVLALAKRVLELEEDAEEHAANVRAVEREACAKLCDAYGWNNRARAGFVDRTCEALGAAIRARGRQPSTIVGVSEGSDG